MYYFNCVLLIDDDPLSNLVTEEMIRRLYIADEIKVFTNAKDALSFIHEFHAEKGNYPELILVDIKMPEMDGFEFVQTLYQKNPFVEKSDFVVSVLSSSSNQEDMDAMCRLGVNYYLHKPLTLEKIKSLLKSIN